MRRTLAFRLSITYSAIFFLSSLLVFLISYLMLVSFARDQYTEGLIDDFLEYRFIFNSRGYEALKDDLLMESKLEGRRENFLRLLSERGEVLLESDMSYWGNMPVDMDIVKKRIDTASPIIKMASVRRYKALILYGNIAPGIVIQMGKSLKKENKFILKFKRFTGYLIGVVLIFSVWTGWFMARRALIGVREVTRTANEIFRGDFDQRVVNIGRDTEIDDLAHTFNKMLDHIQVLITEMREMTDNIAHDLRSPIARIRGTAEMALLNAPSADESGDMAAGIIEDCDRLLSMINTMLEISEAETGAARLRHENIDLAEMVGEAVELFEPLAEERSVRIEIEASQSCMISGDRQKLQRLFSNLIDNAIKYSTEGSSVRLNLACGEKDTLISITDTGIGIDQADQDKIFDRFYRGDKSRSKPGTGLGLPLARAIARAHGGDISVSSQPGEGSTFSVRLPVSPIKA